MIPSHSSPPFPNLALQPSLAGYRTPCPCRLPRAALPTRWHAPRTRDASLSLTRFPPPLATGELGEGRDEAGGALPPLSRLLLSAASSPPHRVTWLPQLRAGEAWSAPCRPHPPPRSRRGRRRGSVTAAAVAWGACGGSNGACRESGAGNTEDSGGGGANTERAWMVAAGRGSVDYKSGRCRASSSVSILPIPPTTALPSPATGSGRAEDTGRRLPCQGCLRSCSPPILFRSPLP